jgi:hypothetical protein
MAARLSLTLLALAAALALPSWTYLRSSDFPVQLIAVPIAAWLVASLVPRPWTVGAGAGAAIIVFMFGGMSPYRGLNAVLCPPWFGYVLIGGVIGLAVCALCVRWSWAFVALACQALLVMPGLVSLSFGQSPRRTVYAYARAVAARDWDGAYAMLTPALQSVEAPQEMRSNNLEFYLPNPRGAVLLETRTAGGAAEVTVGYPYPGSYRLTGFRGSMRPLVLKRQPDGRWLINGLRRHEAEDIMREREEYVKDG